MKHLTVCAALALSGCLGDPNAAVDLMKGSGSVSRSADGATAFRYVIHANAYRGVIDDADQLRAQHETLIANYLGSGGYCQRGYRITSRTMEPSVPAYVYEGRCR